MAQAVVVVCDECGAAPAETVGIRVKDRNYQKDLCKRHVEELLRGTRAPKRGRPRTGVKSTASSSKKRTTRAKRQPARAKRKAR